MLNNIITLQHNTKQHNTKEHNRTQRLNKTQNNIVTLKKNNITLLPIK